MQTKVNKTIKKEKVQGPEKKFRAGAISATVWKNETIRNGEPTEYKTVSFERNYKDKQGIWKTTHSLRMTDLPKAELVLRKSFEYLALSDDSKKEVLIDEEIVY